MRAKQQRVPLKASKQGGLSTQLSCPTREGIGRNGNVFALYLWQKRILKSNSAFAFTRCLLQISLIPLRRYKNKLVLNFPYFLARRISKDSHHRFSKLIVRVAVVGIMLGLSVMILAVAVLKGFKGEIIRKQRNFNGDISLFRHTTGNAFESTPFILTDKDVERLEGVDGVRTLQAVATKPGIINVNDEVEGVVLKGIGRDYDQSRILNMLEKGGGIDFDNDSLSSNAQILVSAYTANRLSLDVGDDFLMYFVQEPLRKRKFTIMGIYNVGIEEIDKTYVIGDLAIIRRLNNWEEGAVGGYEVMVNAFEGIDGVNSELLDLLPLELFSQSVTDRYPELFSWLDLLDINTVIILVLMVIVAAINMISALLIIILERTNMIGILKALGLRNMPLRQMFLFYAAYLIGLGIILGNALGIGICILQYHTHIFSLDESSYYVSYVPIELNWSDVAVLNIGTLGVCLLSLILPSALVAKISPIKAIGFK